MKKNIQQKNGLRETFEIQETNLPPKPHRLSFLGPLLIGIIGFVLILGAGSNNGVGLSGDSVGYIMWARNLLENHSFSKPDGSYLIAWPPLYPAVIDCFKLCGTNDFLAARLINAISFGLIIFVSGLCILRYSGSLTFSVIGSIFTLLSKPLVSISCWAWSEPLFIAMVTAFLILVPEVIKNPTFKLTLLLAIVTSAACLTRYVGVVLLPIGAVALFGGIKTLRRKLIFTSFWGFVSVIPFGMWLLRDFILSGTAMGPRVPSSITLLENIKTAGGIIGSWFIPQEPKIIAGGLFFVLFSILVSATLLVCIYKTIKSKETDWTIITVSLFLALYMTAIIYSATTTSIDFIDDRLLSPLYPVIVVLISILAIKLLGSVLNFSWIKNYSGRRIVRYGFISGICIGISIWAYNTGFYYTMAMTRQLSENGFGFASSSWKNSETITWLKSNKLNGRIYTNDYLCIYILSGIDSHMLPAKPDYFKNLSQSRRKDMEKQLLDFKSALESGGSVYLVWFARHFRQYLYDPEELQQFCDIRLVKKLQDGFIIALYPKSPSNAPAQ